jgi:hypothetical protein
MQNEPGASPAFNKGPDGSAGGSPPVYNCHAILSPADDEGWIAARCSNLPGIAVRGKSQREALAALVGAFKAELSRYGAAGLAVPWNASPETPKPGEQERWIAVHL